MFLSQLFFSLVSVELKSDVITYLFEITPNVNREVLKVLAKNSAKNFYKNKGKN